MKCPECDGRGYLEELLPTKFMGRFTQYKAIECSVCHGKGEVQTNEEWFAGLSTEEKAEVLYKFYCDGRNDELQVYVSINAYSFKEWLKQPHTERDQV